MAITALTPGLLDTKLQSPTDQKKQHDAAIQFESLLIGQLLKAAKDASQGDATFGGDEAGGALLELGQQHLSQALASRGGLGLAALIEKGLHAKSAASGVAVPNEQPVE